MAFFIFVPAAATYLYAASIGTSIASFIGIGAVTATTATAIGAATIGATFSVLKGDKPEDILKNAVLGGITSYVGGTVGKTVSQSVSKNVAQNLISSGVSQSTANAMATVLGSASSAAITGGTSALLQGKNPIDAMLKSGLTATLSGGVGLAVDRVTSGIPGFNNLSSTASGAALSRAVNSAIATSVLGGDASQAFGSSLIDSFIKTVGPDIKNALKDAGTAFKTAASDVSTTQDNINANILRQQSIAKDYEDTISPLQKQQDAAQKAIDTYNNYKDEYDNYSTKYHIADANELEDDRVSSSKYSKPIWLDDDGNRAPSRSSLLNRANTAAETANGLIETFNADYATAKPKIDSINADFTLVKTAYDTLKSDLDNTYQPALDTALNDFNKTEYENTALISEKLQDYQKASDKYKELYGRDPTAEDMGKVIKSDTTDYVKAVQDQYDTENVAADTSGTGALPAAPNATTGALAQAQEQQDIATAAGFPDYAKYQAFGGNLDAYNASIWKPTDTSMAGGVQTADASGGVSLVRTGTKTFADGTVYDYHTGLFKMPDGSLRDKFYNLYELSNDRVRFIGLEVEGRPMRIEVTGGSPDDPDKDGADGPNQEILPPRKPSDFEDNSDPNTASSGPASSGDAFDTALANATQDGGTPAGGTPAGGTAAGDTAAGDTAAGDTAAGDTANDTQNGGLPVNLTSSGASSLTGGLPTRLTTNGALSLTSSDVSSLTGGGLPVNLTTSDILALTGGLSSLSTSDASSLNTGGVSSLNTSSLSALTTDDILALTTNGALSLTSSDVSSLTGGGLPVSLTTSDIVALTGGLSSLSTSDASSLNTGGVSSLNTSDALSLNTSALSSLNTGDLSSLATSTLSSLNTGGVSSLSTSDASSLNTGDLSSLATSALSSLATSALSSLNTGGVSSLTTKDVAALTTSNLQELDQVTIRGTRDIAALTTSDLTALTTSNDTSIPRVILPRLPSTPTYDYSSGALASANQSGGLPNKPTGNMLPGAPVDTSPTLEQLTQLYPQLVNADPSLMQYLQGKASKASYYKYGNPSTLTTPLMAAGTGVPSYGSPFTSNSSYSNPGFGSIPTTGSANLTSTGQSLLNGSPLAAYRKGGPVDHKPEFITGKTGNYVRGKGDGQSDEIPAMLADGEYVFDADIVAALGNGSNEAGSRVLDRMRENIRKHKRSAASGKIPPPAKSPLSYMKG